MKAGFARADITPPVGTPMLGYGITRERLSASNHDPLYFRAVYLTHEGHEALICSFDYCFVAREDGDRWRGVLSREFGIRGDAIMFSATHNHAGPALGTYFELESEAPPRDYIRHVEDEIVKAVAQAKASAREVGAIKSTVTKTKEALHRRRLREGRIVNAPNPGGLVQDSLPICLVEDTAGKPIALFFSVATHVVVMNKLIVSADYPGVACDELDKHLGATCSVFLQGCGGDSRPTQLGEGRENWNWAIGFAEATSIGQAIAKEVKAALPALKPSAPRIRTALVDTHWPLNPWTKQQFIEHREKLKGEGSVATAIRQWCDRHVRLIELGQQRNYIPVLMQGIQLAEGIRMLAIEGEPLAPHGIAMEKSFTSGTTFGLGYANGEAMYLVASDQIDPGGYEPESFWEYGQPGPLAKGLETARDNGIAELKRRGIS